MEDEYQNYAAIYQSFYEAQEEMNKHLTHFLRISIEEIKKRNKKIHELEAIIALHKIRWMR